MLSGKSTAIDEILLVPAKADAERHRVAECWKARGGLVIPLDRFWEPPEKLPPGKVRVYGNDTFCLVLAQLLNLDLVSPADDWLLGLSFDFLKRELRLATLRSLPSFPCFVKPLIPKQFRATVYQTSSELEEETRGLGDEAVLIAEVVSILAEARGFYLEGKLQSLAVYEGVGEPEAFLRTLEDLPQPTTCVIDVALLDGRGWAVLEANATWGAGLNGCEPSAVVDCLRAAVRV